MKKDLESYSPSRSDGENEQEELKSVQAEDKNKLCRMPREMLNTAFRWKTPHSQLHRTQRAQPHYALTHLRCKNVGGNVKPKQRAEAQ